MEYVVDELIWNDFFSGHSYELLGGAGRGLPDCHFDECNILGNETSKTGTAGIDEIRRAGFAQKVPLSGCPNNRFETGTLVY